MHINDERIYEYSLFWSHFRFFFIKRVICHRGVNLLTLSEHSDQSALICADLGGHSKFKVKRTKTKVRLSIVIPCFNEELTLGNCVNRVLSISDENLSLEIIIVDDCSNDNSINIALDLAKKHSEIRVLRHEKNRGKGAALRTGFQNVSGDFVAVQDADLEYDPNDLKRLLAPLVSGDADVVLGSRFLSTGFHRVLYFWHYMGNRFLTFLSNMFTDLNLTDMETCYKIFRREIIQGIDIKENRFGFEPEIVAKMAQKRLRIYEMGISYRGRTYEEGKKIKAKDGFRAIYCIIKYNAHKAPIPIQFIIYIFIGGFAAAVNLISFLVLLNYQLSVTVSAISAFIFAAFVNYLLCVLILFRHKAKWNSVTEIFFYCIVVCLVALLDLYATQLFIRSGNSPFIAKSAATLLALILNFLGRKFIVFPEPSLGRWKPQEDK